MEDSGLLHGPDHQSNDLLIEEAIPRGSEYRLLRLGSEYRLLRSPTMLGAGSESVELKLAEEAPGEDFLGLIVNDLDKVVFAELDADGVSRIKCHRRRHRAIGFETHLDGFAGGGDRLWRRLWRRRDDAVIPREGVSDPGAVIPAAAFSGASLHGD